MQYLAKETFPCNSCQKNFYDFDVDKFWYVNQCLHLFCRGCLVKTIDQQYIKSEGKIKCLIMTCNKFLDDYDFIVYFYFFEKNEKI